MRKNLSHVIIDSSHLSPRHNLFA
ncbi:hypothetical protein CAJAP_02241 [Camponotus japonicus]